MWDYSKVKEKAEIVEEPMSKNVAAFYTIIEPQENPIFNEKRNIALMLFFSIVTASLTITIGTYGFIVVGLFLNTISLSIAIVFSIIFIIFFPLSMLKVVEKLVKNMTESRLLLRIFRITFTITSYGLFIFYFVR